MDILLIFGSFCLITGKNKIINPKEKRKMLRERKNKK